MTAQRMFVAVSVGLLVSENGRSVNLDGERRHPDASNAERFLPGGAAPGRRPNR
jgi:hypothetical protein